MLEGERIGVKRNRTNKIVLLLFSLSVFFSVMFGTWFLRSTRVEGYGNIQTGSSTIHVVNQTSPACTTGDCYHSTIQDAVDHASSGDRIIVCPGTYVENVEIQGKSLNISSYSGDPSDTTVSASITSSPVFEIWGDDAEYTNISGFTVWGALTYMGIFINEVNYTKISNNNISGNEYGVYLLKSYYTTIENNNIIRNDKGAAKIGIIFVSSKNNTIRYNNITNSDNGIYFYKSLSTNNAIYYNNILDNIDNLYNEDTDFVNASFNWWGTTSYSEISSKIEEGTGEVDFIPLLDAPYPIGNPRSPWSKSTTYLNSSSIYIGSSVEISTLIRDNETSIPIADYYTEIYANETMISNGTSNTNGWYNYTWTPSTLGTYTIKSAIYNDTDKNYIAVYNDTKTLTVYETQPVGGIYIAPNKLELLAPYIGLTILLAVTVTTIAYVKKRKKFQQNRK